MSTPRDRDRDGFDDGRPGGPADWQEPAHLGGGDTSSGTPPTPSPDTPGATPADRPGTTGSTGSTAAGEPGQQEPWQPPGWDLPAVEPHRPGTASGTEPWQAPGPEAPPTGERRRGLGGLFGSRPQPQGQPDRPDHLDRPDQPGPLDRPEQPVDGAGFPPADPRVMVPPADTWGTQAWAMSVGWVLSDGTAPEDEPLSALVRSAPVRPGKEDRAGRVLRGRGNGLDLVAFDIVSPVGRGFVSTHAVTAAPVLGAVPSFRLSPARLWRHGTGGLVQVPSPDPEFDRRWVLLAAEDGPQVRALAADPVIRQLLLGSDDGDELWSAAGFVAAVRPDANRPQLIEHHARILAGVVAALSTAG